MIRDEETFNVEFESSAQEWEQRLQTFMVISGQDIATFRQDVQAGLDILTERIERLIQQHVCMKRNWQFNPKVGRPQEIEMIERLQFILHTKKIQHGTVLKEIAHCKVMLSEATERPVREVPDILQLNRYPNCVVP
jgi:hypothetical protein